MENPFIIINERLNVIERLIINLNAPSQVEVYHEQDGLVKIDVAAEITGYKKGYIYELVNKNEIPFIRRGRSIRFSKDELYSWMKSGRPSIVNETIKNLQKA